MANHHQTSNLWLLTGPTHSGKTTFLLKMLDIFKQQRKSCKGLISPARFSEGRRIGYDGMDIRTGKIFLLARVEGPPEWPKAGRYFFDPEGLAEAKSAIAGGVPANLTVVDEIGHLELRREGLWTEIQSLLTQPQIKWFVVRESLTARFLERFGRETPVLRFSDARLQMKLESILSQTRHSFK